MLTFFIAYLLCGMIIGFCAGLFGIGGGLIGVPALFILFHMQGMSQPISMHMAVGTIFATVVVTSTTAIYSHYQKGTIVLPLFRKIVIGTVAGSGIGIIISRHMHGVYLQRFFALFLLFIAMQMLINRETKPQNELPGLKRLFVTTTLLGTISGMCGLGGGVLMVPYLYRCGVPIRNAIATVAACILPVALVGALGYMFTNEQIGDTHTLHSGFIYWPAFLGVSITSMMFAPIGVKVTHIIPMTVLKKTFSAFLFTIGLGMLLHGIDVSTKKNQLMAYCNYYLYVSAK